MQLFPILLCRCIGVRGREARGEVWAITLNPIFPGQVATEILHIFHSETFQTHHRKLLEPMVRNLSPQHYERPHLISWHCSFGRDEKDCQMIAEPLPFELKMRKGSQSSFQDWKRPKGTRQKGTGREVKF